MFHSGTGTDELNPFWRSSPSLGWKTGAGRREAQLASATFSRKPFRPSMLHRLSTFGAPLAVPPSYEAKGSGQCLTGGLTDISGGEGKQRLAQPLVYDAPEVQQALAAE